MDILERKSPRIWFRGEGSVTPRGARKTNILFLLLSPRRRKRICPSKVICFICQYRNTITTAVNSCVSVLGIFVEPRFRAQTTVRFERMHTKNNLSIYLSFPKRISIILCSRNKIGTFHLHSCHWYWLWMRSCNRSSCWSCILPVLDWSQTPIGTNRKEIQDQARERVCNFYGRFQARIIFQTCFSRDPHARRNRIQTNETKKGIEKILRDPAYKRYGNTTHSNGNKIDLEIAFHERNSRVNGTNKIWLHPHHTLTIPNVIQDYSGAILFF